MTRIAIAGAGITGAYLYRRLTEKNCFDGIDIFDIPSKTQCGIAPCAWGASTGFQQFLVSGGLDPELYIQNRVDSILIDEVPTVVNLMIINKPNVIKDLLGGIVPNRTALDPAQYDRIIDATGVARALLPPCKDDVRIPCIQYLVESSQPLPTRISFGGIGYAWIFPIGANQYHIGCGNLKEDPGQKLKSLKWISADTVTRVLCRCSGEVRLAAPHNSLPLVSSSAGKEIWGVGEAIGCVSPLAGDGIIPGLKSVEILLRHWNDAEAYTTAILAEFSWMKRERIVIDKMIARKKLGLGDAWILKKNSTRVGMRMGIRQAFSILENMPEGKIV
ncbi:MAG TPA: hypothetical protein PKM59_06845 [Thermodesulfobacteriota bacterium]|nr:hypothetical protein [Deltaproteobacteria bacterium]HNR13010.1 hypothetical protein [Thermodesulfobacteriota bacterium]HNU70630.1 hypothetical protein [Thermodesulfobacteriota bacterium]